MEAINCISKKIKTLTNMKKLTTIILATLVLASCKKKDDPTPNTGVDTNTNNPVTNVPNNFSRDIIGTWLSDSAIGPSGVIDFTAARNITTQYYRFDGQTWFSGSISEPTVILGDTINNGKREYVMLPYTIEGTTIKNSGTGMDAWRIKKLNSTQLEIISLDGLLTYYNTKMQ